MGARKSTLPNIAVLGAGLIGQRHAQIISNHSSLNLAALADPSPIAVGLGETLSCPIFDSLKLLLASDVPVDGIIVATPNNTHLEISLSCIKAGIPVLVEKPLAVNSEEAKAIANASMTNSTPVLVGHHRRYHNASQATREIIQSGKLGELVGGQVTWCLRKPDDYFDQGAWRKTAGGGPVWINLIHEIDLLRYFFGEVAEVTAMTSNSIRGAEIEDTAAIVLRFENGALVNVLISDAAPSPWHFEGASGENPNLAFTGQDGMRLMGTQGALSFPSLRLWQHDNAETGDWTDPIGCIPISADAEMGGEVALTRQIEHFCKVARFEEKPLVSADDGLLNILVTEAILLSAKEGRTVRLSEQFSDLSACAQRSRLAG